MTAEPYARMVTVMNFTTVHSQSQRRRTKNAAATTDGDVHTAAAAHNNKKEEEISFMFDVVACDCCINNNIHVHYFFITVCTECEVNTTCSETNLHVKVTNFLAFNSQGI